MTSACGVASGASARAGGGGVASACGMASGASVGAGVGASLVHSTTVPAPRSAPAMKPTGTATASAANFARRFGFCGLP